MSLPNDWRDVIGPLQNPDAFLIWVRDNLPLNALTKQFHPGNITLHKGMAVYLATDGKIYPFDINNPTHYNQYVGVILVNALICTVVTYGVLYAEGSGWLTGVPYFIGVDGLLTSTEPVIGLSKLVAVGVDKDRVLVLSSGNGSGSTTGDENIDGGFANSTYLITQNVDGGGA